ncbi:MAG: ABC transporter ATP-binding protein [Methylococcales bacterium]|nr:ABC transporter ATP-binding protein [Methylococcales bacterium]
MTALTLTQLKKTYRNGFTALKGIDLTVEKGEFFALLGPNGAGKSTTIGIISSLVTLTSGQVKVFGYDLIKQRNQAKQLIGVVPQEINFNQFETVEQIVLNQAGYQGISSKDAKRRCQIVLEQVDLWDRRKSISRRLSGGMKRRLMIARAMVHDPKLLILDEPTAGVDIEIRRSMWIMLTQLNQQGTTIILTTHYLEEAENLCRHVAMIDHGEIVENSSMRELLQRLPADHFILDLKQPLTSPPKLADFALTQVSPTALEVMVPKHKALNALFQQLSAHGIQVISLKNKANRLEQLFLDRLSLNERT